MRDSCCSRLDGQKASNLPTMYNNGSEIQLMTCNDSRQVTRHTQPTQDVKLTVRAMYPIGSG